MLDFTDINERPEWEELPSEALIINGQVVDNVIKGFRTLNVKGRGIIGKRVNAVEIEGRDGAMYMGSTRPVRNLVVKYELVANDNREFIESFIRINMLLDKDQMEIRFKDEIDRYYIGTLGDVSDIPEGTLSIISELSFICNDSYKYSDPVVEKGDSSVEFNINTFYKTKPLYIKVVPDEDTSTITINSLDKQIQLVNGSFVKGREVLFDFGEDISITSANGNELKRVSLHSDLEDFYIAKGNTITFEEGGILEVATREVML